MGRKRIYPDSASRQAAYRRRKRESTKPQPLVVRAPLTVVGEDGAKLVEIADGSSGPALKIYGTGGKVAVVLAAREFGGLLALGGSENALVALLHGDRDQGRAQVLRGEQWVDLSAELVTTGGEGIP